MIDGPMAVAEVEDGKTLEEAPPAAAAVAPPAAAHRRRRSCDQQQNMVTASAAAATSPTNIIRALPAPGTASCAEAGVEPLAAVLMGCTMPIPSQPPPAAAEAGAANTAARVAGSQLQAAKHQHEASADMPCHNLAELLAAAAPSGDQVPMICSNSEALTSPGSTSVEGVGSKAVAAAAVAPQVRAGVPISAMPAVVAVKAETPKAEDIAGLATPLHAADVPWTTPHDRTRSSPSKG